MIGLQAGSEIIKMQSNKKWEMVPVAISGVLSKFLSSKSGYS